MLSKFAHFLFYYFAEITPPNEIRTVSSELGLYRILVVFLIGSARIGLVHGAGSM